MKKFEVPQMAIVNLAGEDIIMASPCTHCVENTICPDYMCTDCVDCSGVFRCIAVECSGYNQ